MFCQFEEYYGGEELHYYCAIREESYQVFIIEEEETEEKLIYDFSSPEEIITLTYNDYPYARTDGEHRYGYLPGQLEYSVCKFTDGEVDYSNDSSCWIEGVGATLNNPFAFELRFFPFDYPKLGKSIYVCSCMKDGEYIFIKDWMATPIVDSVDDRIRVDKSNNEFNIYNLQGQRKDKTHPRGIYIQDHLGNNREVVDSAGTVKQITHYYPFGTPYADPSTILGTSLQPYKYNFSIERGKRKPACSSEREKNRPEVNGKEFDKMHGLDTYDYGARQYNPVTARWDRMDPLCEKYYSVSPYGYCGGNPVNRIDPDGRKVLLVGDIELALQTIKSTLPVELQNYVVLENNYISVEEMLKGLESTEYQGSGNYMSLYELVSDPVHTVEFSISDIKKANYRNGIEALPNEIPFQFNDPVCDEYNNFTPEPDGSLGWSLAPESHTWTKNDLLQRNEVPKNRQLFSTNGNYQVQINGRLRKYDSLNIVLVKATAHELYSHILHMFKGIDSLHTPIREGPGSNLELENRSIQSVNEAVINYNH